MRSNVATQPAADRFAPIELPPHIRERVSRNQIDRALFVALLPCIVVAMAIFGMWTLVLFGAAALSAALGDWLCHSFFRRVGRPAWLQAPLIGVLLVMTLPPTISWPLAAVGAFVGAVVGKTLQGGHSNYLWHPTLIGWAFLQLAFPAALAPTHWPLLQRQHLFTGSIHDARTPEAYYGYFQTEPTAGGDAWRLKRPIDTLTAHYTAPAEGRPAASLRNTALRELPPFGDTLWGTVGGGIGETSSLAILAGGLWLIFRGQLRWSSPLCAMLAAAILAACWPLGGEPPWRLPLLTVQDGFPIGVTLVLYHLTSGGLLLTAFFLAADPISTPLTTKGHAVFGAGLGALTIFIRVLGVSPGSCYWALLAMNTLVPLIDRMTRRRVYGT